MRKITLGRLILFSALMTVAIICSNGCPDPGNNAVLFVSDDYSDSIGRVVSFRNPADADGDVRPDTWLEGDETEIGIWAGAIFTDAAGRLYIQMDTSIIVFENGTEANGNRPPDRLAILEDLGDIVGGIALGPTEEWLLVIDSEDGNRFKSYANPTSGAFDGIVPLTAAGAAHDEFEIPAGAQYAGGKLYVKDRSDGDIYAYAGGEMATISLGMEWRISSFFIDNADNLYVAAEGDIAIFRHVSTLEGDVEPDRILTVPGASSLGGLVVGSDGTGYITDPIRNEIYIYHDIATRDGEEPPDGTIGGPRTGLSGPGDLALYEP